MPGAAISGDLSLKVGLIFLFNLIVGTGALALPKAFSQAGWLLGCILIGVLAFFSYVCVTFTIEALSVANAVLVRRQKVKSVPSGSNASALDQPQQPTESTPTHSFTNSLNAEASNLRMNELEPLLSGAESSQPSQFEIKQKIELSEMARIFYGKIGANLFFVCMFVYLTGDLAIYATSVAKTIRDLACTGSAPNASGNSSEPAPVNDDMICWPDTAVTRINAYRIFVAVFLVCAAPFTFFNLQKTKYLQMFTSFFRWSSMLLMISLAIRQITINSANGQAVRREAADFNHFTQLFGTAVYAFMCHHSLPSIVTPITGKQHLSTLFSVTYGLVLTFYLLLSLTGVFAFETLSDLYTLNFQPNAHGITAFDGLIVFEYYLELYPIVTLSTNFPIIAITLRNNLLDLARQVFKTVAARSRFVHLCLFRSANVTFGILSLLIPAVISLCTADVGLLIAITGSYPGVAIQYVIPVCLVYGARREVLRLSELAEPAESSSVETVRSDSSSQTWYFSRLNRVVFESRLLRHVSWFWSPVWLVAVLAWSAFTVCLVTVHLFADNK